MKRFVSALVLVLAGFVPALAFAEHAWTPLTPLPTVVEGACDAVIGNKIYVAFGYSGGDTNALRIYDIDTDTWSLGPPAPTPGRSEHYRGVEHGGKLYCVGGRPVPATWRFEPDTNTWAMLAPPPAGTIGSTAAVRGNSIYLFGGRTGTAPCDGGASSSIYRYDIGTDTWSPAGSLAVRRSDATSARVGRYVYVFGGCADFATFYDSVERYDTVTQTSVLLTATLPGGPRANAAAAARGQAEHEVHVTGGWRSSGDVQPNHVVYDVDTGTFSVGTPMPTHCPAGVPRAEHELVYHGGRVYAVAGACPARGLSIDALDVLKLSP